MARKKKSKKSAAKKSKAPAVEKKTLPEGFWRQAAALFGGVIIAPLLILATFGLGGSLPTWILDAAKWLIGGSAYILPVVLVYVAVHIFRDEDSHLPKSQVAGIFVFLAAMAGFFHLFVDQSVSLEKAGDGSGGGIVGHLIDSALLSLVSWYVAGIILLVIATISVLFVLKIPVSSLVLSIARVFGYKGGDKEEDEEAEEEEEKPEFQLNEGVPVQKGARLSSLKDTAEKLTDKEDHAALTAIHDPNWKLPSVNLLNKKQDQANAGDVKGNAQIIKDTLKDFNINVEMEGANIGPRVTQYTLKPPSGVRLTKITALDNNLALNLAATSIRIEAPIPGKRAVGIEVPNEKSATVRLRGILESNEWNGETSPLPIAMGRDIAGNSVVGELNDMPHMLVAGATGSGKSVMINSILTSLLYRNSPSEMKLILVDPKRVELTPFNDIPHLLTPVITEPEKCISALKWAVAEMERRYTSLADSGKRNIGEYNKAKKEEAMPYIVIVIDELADLMMLAARDVESLIVRLAQKARAVGIHLVLATQRPSVDVITGLIKANIPARVAFTVASQVDSRTILDQIGAEKLLGKGDMLMLTPDVNKPRRIQAPLISDQEVQAVTDHVRLQRPPEYDDEIVAQPVQIGGRGGIMMDGDSSADDSLYKDAVQVVVESGKASASLLQRRLRVGYARAARLIETMEDQGIIGPADGARPREVLVSNTDEVFGGDKEE